MANFKVRIAAEGVDTHITVNASNESMAKEIAIIEFKQRYPAWRNRKIVIVDIKKIE